MARMSKHTSILITPATQTDLKVLAAETKHPMGETIAALITLRRRLQSLARIAEEKAETCITIAEIHALLQ